MSDTNLTVPDWMRERYPLHCQRIIETSYQLGLSTLGTKRENSFFHSGQLGLWYMFCFRDTSEGHEYWARLGVDDPSNPRRAQ